MHYLHEHNLSLRVAILRVNQLYEPCQRASGISTSDVQVIAQPANCSKGKGQLAVVVIQLTANKDHAVPQIMVVAILLH